MNDIQALMGFTQALQDSLMREGGESYFRLTICPCHSNWPQSSVSTGHCIGLMIAGQYIFHRGTLVFQVLTQ